MVVSVLINNAVHLLMATMNLELNQLELISIQWVATSNTIVKHGDHKVHMDNSSVGTWAQFQVRSNIQFIKTEECSSMMDRCNNINPVQMVNLPKDKILSIYKWFQAHIWIVSSFTCNQT